MKIFTRCITVFPYKPALRLKGHPMFLPCFVFILAALISSNIAIAGLDDAGRFDDVIAIYYFEDATDSGPREFNGTLLENASIINNGKTDKCLRLGSQDSFGMLNTLFLGLVDREFSITVWIKLRRQSEKFNLSLAGHNDDDTFDGGIRLSVLSSGNIQGDQFDFEDEKVVSIVSEDNNIADNEWHHIAFTKYANTYRLFIDAEVVKEHESSNYLGFVSDNTFISLSIENDVDITGNIFIDELGFFEMGFSIYEIEGLYDDGLSSFLEAMPVNPKQKVATTWGTLKTRR